MVEEAPQRADFMLGAAQNHPVSPDPGCAPLPRALGAVPDEGRSPGAAADIHPSLSLPLTAEDRSGRRTVLGWVAGPWWQRAVRAPPRSFLIRRWDVTAGPAPHAWGGRGEIPSPPSPAERAVTAP